MKIEDKRYLLIENRETVQETEAAAMYCEFNKGDRILVLPADLSEINRIRALEIAKRRFVRGNKELKAMGAELHAACSDAMEMVDLAVRWGRRGLVFGALAALFFPLALAPYLHYAAPTGAKGRAILDADRSYLNYVRETKHGRDKTPVIDKERTKADLAEFKAWQEKEETHD
ncbi:hypothetical protein [Rhizobium sp. BK176]|uniref:hypothetical protein n=1 Tax=Rhizobium sp. BK176 TaxID=2587071 RepID=UPI002168DB69|nr:hypothetical protein [Rhizobium sp. BK176]MCS4089568.1 hypothetical protein [Rhizobium sp. BK176]